MALTVAQIAEMLQGRLEGGGSALVTGVAPIRSAGPHDLAFFQEERYRAQLAECRAAAVLVPMKATAPASCPVIRVKDPQAGFIAVIAALGLEKTDPPFRGVHPKAHVDPAARLGQGVDVGPFVTVCAGARIGDGCILYPGVFIDREVTLGKHCRLHPHACVMRGCTLGNEVVLGPGCVVGSEGFGFYPTPKGLVRVPQLGTVILEDGVNLGANTAVDRARFDATIVRRGAALDNLIHIAHNCSIGEHTAIAALTGVAGGTSIGSGCLIGGHVGIGGHIAIGDGTRVAGSAGVTGNVEAGQAVSGFYAHDHQDSLREYIALRRLPDLIRRVREIEKKLQG